MSLQGKGFFIWKILSCESGDIKAIASLAHSAGLTHVLMKVANGNLAYNIDAGSGADYAQLLTQTLHAAGVQAYGWHYVYGDDPLGEANRAIQRIRQLGLDGYVIDAESEYKAPGKKAAAQKFMSALRAAFPNLPIALSSYRYPSYHKELPWQEFLDGCDYNMPQVYWMKAHNPGEQLTQSVNQFQRLTPYRPIIPTGAAFRESGWQPAPSEVQEFLVTVKQLNLSATNFWEWSDARSGIMPGVWETIRDFSWSGTPVSLDICQKYVDALNTHNAQLVTNLYNPNAVQITSNRTIQGSEAICAWFTSLFTDVLPSAAFTLTSYSGTGTARHFTWTARSSKGVVNNGNDTFGLLNDKIAYHYSFFTVQSG